MVSSLFLGPGPLAAPLLLYRRLAKISGGSGGAVRSNVLPHSSRRLNILKCTLKRDTLKRGSLSANANLS
jgi:hypothetical protein